MLVIEYELDSLQKLKILSQFQHISQLPAPDAGFGASRAFVSHHIGGHLLTYSRQPLQDQCCHLSTILFNLNYTGGLDAQCAHFARWNFNSCRHSQNAPWIYRWFFLSLRWFQHQPKSSKMGSLLNETLLVRTHQLSLWCLLWSLSSDCTSINGASNLPMHNRLHHSHCKTGHIHETHACHLQKM